MRWRWCVCDLDGTLLDPEGALAPRDRAAVARLRAGGVEVVLATGRLDLMALRFAHELGVTAPIVACNGALVRDPVTRAIVHAQAIPAPLVARLRQHLRDRGHHYLLYTADRVYHTEGSPRLARLDRYNAGARPEHRVPLSPLRELDLLPSLPPVLKLLVSEVGEEAMAELESLLGGAGGLALVASERGVIDITADGTSKGAGLEVLARARGIDLARTVAFGDHHNDLSMLERCGLPIAMGNAEPEVKRVAAFVTRSNAEAGVAHAVDTLRLAGGPAAASPPGWRG
ncbi:MAG TPA: Cof-type HAD-IIB family hydrolase [Anaeromyxobacter sp.]|nr:Cof-type HAD-IIB family hydrolase [Anaeromyxobacter sp.]